MGVVLTILKIIGITLLILLLVIILLLCLILFVPIRYRLHLNKDEKVQVKAKITYLLHAITASAGYVDDKKYAKIKVLGITIKNFFPSEEELKKQTEKQKKKEERLKKKQQKIKNKSKNNSQNKNKKQKENLTKTVNQKVNKEKSQTFEKPMEKKQDVSTLKNTPSKVEQPVTKQTQQTNDTEPSTNNQDSNSANLITRIRTFIKKLIDKCKNIKYTICNLLDKLINIKETILWYLNLFQKEESKRAVKSAKTQVIRLLKHIKPKKIKGYVEFGFEDPATTGDIFGKICMFYPLYGNNVVIVPDFEHNILKGELKLKGRIYIVTLLHIAWKIVFDKDIRTLYEILTGGVKHEQ